MTNSQELFQINKRINQIKRNLQLRQQKAQQWSVPYQKILQKSSFNQTCQSYFRNTHSGKFMNTSSNQFNNNDHNPLTNQFTDNDHNKTRNNKFTNTYCGKFNNKQDEYSPQPNFQTKTQRKIFYQKKAKQSRKKINLFHNQLKQLQQLLQKKTKLYVKKQSQQQNKLKSQSLNYDKLLNTKPSSQIKTMTKGLSLTGIFNKTSSSKTSFRTLKDRVNPFSGLKVQKMIQLYQQAKHSGKQNIVNHTLGMGIQFTPYSYLKKDMIKKQDQASSPSQLKIFGENNSNLFQSQGQQNIKPNNSDENKLKKAKNLSKMLQTKIQGNKEIYLQAFHSNRQNELSPIRNRNKLNIFEHRMKKLIQQTSNIEQCQGNYIEMLKKRKYMEKKSIFKSSVGKIRANNTYKTVFQMRQ